MSCTKFRANRVPNGREIMPARMGLNHSLAQRHSSACLRLIILKQFCKLLYDIENIFVVLK